MPTDNAPTSAHTAAHGDALDHLNQEQKSSPVKMHQFVSFSQLQIEPPAPSVAESRASVLEAAHQSLSLRVKQGKAAIAKAKPTIAATKRVALVATSRLNQMATNTLGPKEDEEGRLSRSSSTSSTKSLFHKRRLPKLKIPDLDAGAEQALNSVCSTDTQDSPNFRVLELSPASRDLKREWLADEHPADVAAEFHNMLSARRRVRKGEFGAEVTRYRQSRPTWDDSWCLRIENDNVEDRALLRRLTDALQQQKDRAAEIVRRGPDLYPALEPVSAPGCTLKLYWQPKSSYR